MNDKITKLLMTLIICLTIIFSFCSYNSSLNIRSVNVSWKWVVKVQPDTLTINLYIQEKASTTKEAQELVDSATKDFIQQAQTIWVNKKSIQTSNYSVYPNYYREENSSKQTLDSYTASQNITITLNWDNFISLWEQVLSLAPTVWNILVNWSSFTVTNKNKWENDARKLALDMAYQKAQQLANGWWAKIWKVLNISENISSNWYYPVYANAKVMNESVDMAGWLADDGVGLEAWENEIIVQIDISYQLK